jgi:hypothetical protein
MIMLPRNLAFIVVVSLLGGCGQVAMAKTLTKRQAPPEYLSFNQEGITTGLGNGPPDPEVVQALRLVSAQNRRRISEVHGVLLMMPNRIMNEAFCQALVSNLNFFDDGLLLSFQAKYPRASLRLTYLYDSRKTEELTVIERNQRPHFFSRTDCPELVSNFDFDLSYNLLNLLKINRERDGPWLVAVDPARRRAVVFDLSRYKADELSSAIDLWTEVLQNPNRWRRTKFFEESFVDLVIRNDPIRVIQLPDSFLSPGIESQTPN